MSEEVAQPNQLTLIIIKPALPGLAEAIRIFSGKRHEPVKLVDSITDAVKLVLGGTPAVIITSLHEESEMNAVLKLVKFCAHDRRDKTRMLVVSKVSNRKVKDTLISKGVHEVMSDKAAASAIVFKTVLLLNQLQRLNSSSSDTMKVKGSGTVANDLQHVKGPAFVVSSEIIPQDLWLIKGVPPRKVGVQWVVECEGPDPDSGSWEVVTATGRVEQWAWRALEADGKPAANLSGWQFSGNRPTVDPESGKWKFIAAKPDLFFKSGPEKGPSKIRFDAEKGIILAADSPDVPARIAATKKIGELVRKERERQAAEKIKAIRAAEAERATAEALRASEMLKAADASSAKKKEKGPVLVPTPSENEKKSSIGYMPNHAADKEAEAKKTSNAANKNKGGVMIAEGAGHGPGGSIVQEGAGSGDPKSAMQEGMGTGKPKSAVQPGTGIGSGGSAMQAGSGSGSSASAKEAKEATDRLAKELEAKERSRAEKQKSKDANDSKDAKAGKENISSKDKVPKTFAELEREVSEAAAAAKRASGEKGEGSKSEKTSGPSEKPGGNKKNSGQAASASKTPPRKNPLNFFIKLSEMANSGRGEIEILRFVTDEVCELVGALNAVIVVGDVTLASSAAAEKRGHAYSLDLPKLKTAITSEASDVIEISAKEVAVTVPLRLGDQIVKNLGTLVLFMEPGKQKQLSGHQKFLDQVTKHLARMVHSKKSTAA